MEACKLSLILTLSATIVHLAEEGLQGDLAFVHV